MKYRYSSLIAALFLVLSTSGQSDSLRNALNALKKPSADTAAVTLAPAGPGKIVIHSSSAIDSLEKAQRGKIDLTGYRLQVFLGPLTEAKKERSKFLAAYPDESCYVVQNIPDHAVRIGDYRDLPEAQQALKKYKPNYSGAFIVKDKIEMPRLRKPSRR